MAFRFQRRVTIIPGLRLNFGKRGVSVSAGIRGASVTAGRRGLYGNLGAPGTGLSYRTRLDKSPAHQRRVQQATQSSAGQNTLSGSGVLQLSVDEQGKLLMTDEQQQPASTALVRHAWSHHAEHIRAFLRQEANRINADQELLVNIHHDTPTQDTKPPEYEPEEFTEQEPVQPELPELPPAPKYSKQRFWHRCLPSLEARRSRHNHELKQAWQQETTQVTQAIATLTAQHSEQHQAWQRGKAKHEALQHALATSFAADLREDTDFMSTVLESELAQLDWPRETHIDFEIEQNQIKLDVDLPTAEAFPSREAALNKAERRLLIKHKSATQQRKEYAAHVHGVILRLIGVVFVTLPSIEKLVIAGYTQDLNTATGHEEDRYLLSVGVSRAQWQHLNLASPERIDPIHCLEQFDLTRDMTKTGIFKPISIA
ncbi:MAG: DUF4236 domain-containing protein [Idiomarina sp.]|nr:DUF4236 domain-containing protein [Idiomarina sp.]